MGSVAGDAGAGHAAAVLQVGDAAAGVRAVAVRAGAAVEDPPRRHPRRLPRYRSFCHVEQFRFSSGVPTVSVPNMLDRLGIFVSMAALTLWVWQSGCSPPLLPLRAVN